MTAPLSEELILLLGLSGLLMLVVSRRDAIREFFRRFAEALHDEWRGPR